MTALATYVSAQQSVEDIAHAHLLWIQSAGQQGKRANFRGADLRGQRIQGLNFSQASFRNADMQGVQFVECNLEEADFAEADASMATFESCHLKLGNFSRAQLHQAKFFRCAMEKSVYLQAVLQGTSFELCNLREANFREATMPSAKFTSTEMQRCTMRSVHAVRAQFDYVRLDGIDGKEACFDYAKFTHVAWYGSQLRGASFENAQCIESDISVADEVDATAVAAVEKTMAQLRAVEFKNVEKLKEDLETSKHALEQRTQILAAREKQVRDKEAQWRSWERDVSHGVERNRARAMILRAVAACWWMVSAMIITLLVRQFYAVGLAGLNVLEVIVVLCAVMLTMALFISSAILTYRASSSLWRVLEHLEEVKSDEMLD